MASQYQRSHSGSGSPPQTPSSGVSKLQLCIKCPFPLRDPDLYKNHTVACNSAEFKDLSDWRDHMKRVHRDDYNCASCRQRHQQRDDSLKEFVEKHATCTLPPSLSFRPEIMTKKQSDADRELSLRGKNNLTILQKILWTLQVLFPDDIILLNDLWPQAPLEIWIELKCLSMNNATPEANYPPAPVPSQPQGPMLGAERDLSMELGYNPNIAEAYGKSQLPANGSTKGPRDSGYGSIGGDQENDTPEGAEAFSGVRVSHGASTDHEITTHTGTHLCIDPKLLTKQLVV